MITPPLYQALNEIAEALEALEKSRAATPQYTSIHRQKTLERIQRTMTKYKTVKPEIPT